MSLDMILGHEAAVAVLSKWPERPYTLKLPNDSPIGQVVNAQAIRGFLDAGCAPSNYVNVFHRSEGLHPARFTADDRVAPASVQLLLDQGCTIQLRELNRWFPSLERDLCEHPGGNRLSGVRHGLHHTAQQSRA